MLSFYSQSFSTVEINSTFYRLPSKSVVESWAQETPGSFRFAIKAPQAITHRKRLKDVAELTEALLQTVEVLKRRQGPVLFQLPPNFKKDLPRLEAFLYIVPRRVKVAFEFRHASWFDDEVFDCLRAYSCALCVADVDDAPRPAVIGTTSWGYVRLRRAAYTTRQLRDWIKRLKATNWKEAYVFFKHEDTGTGPKFAARFLELAN